MKLSGKVISGIVVASGIILPGLVFAGTGGTAEFGQIYTTVQGWLQGTLGKVIALSALGVGLGMGVVRQSIMAVVLGVAMGLATYYGPQILDNVVVATTTPVEAVEMFLKM